MAKELHCRYEGCGHVEVRKGGMLPLVCPGCGLTAKWSSEAVTENTVVPRPSYKLTLNDRRFLRGLKIDPE